MGPHVAEVGDVELLARLLGRGGLAVAASLVERFGTLAALGRAEEVELITVPGVGPRRAARVHAALQLGRRALVDTATASPVVDAATAAALLAPGLAGLHVEELHGLYLDRRNRPLARRRLTQGSDRYTVVDPRQIFRPAVALGAAGVVLAHNHPSGDPTPSAQDREVTRRVAAAGRTLGVELLDHLVVAGEAWVSLRERGELGPAPAAGPCWTG